MKKIQYKKLYFKGLSQWLCIIALPVLGTFVHNGFNHLFSFMALIFFLTGLVLLLGVVVVIGKTKNDPSKKEMGIALAKYFCADLVKKHGVDRVYAEIEQWNTDKLITIAIILCSIFTGHFLWAIAFVFCIISRSIMQIACLSYDDMVLENL